MAAVDDTDMNALPTHILKELAATAYACTGLTQLSGGTANFVFRGDLAQALESEDGSQAKKTVIVKNSEDFLPGNRAFAIDVSRCVNVPLVLWPIERVYRIIF